ncbi:MAG: hypothetical protein IT259_19265, partial [Saprospiraceae bacterium]|nr:hypothetical protein [Saprospiraceae bacterium]
MQILRQYTFPVLFFGIFGLLFSPFSCTSDTPGRPRPDVSNIRVSVPLLRFDQDIFALDTAHVTEGLTALGQKYPEMLPL